MEETKGTETNLPCPWCDEDLDLTGLDVTPGSVIDCDFCSNKIEIILVKEVVIVKARCFD